MLSSASLVAVHNGAKSRQLNAYLCIHPDALQLQLGNTLFILFSLHGKVVEANYKSLLWLLPRDEWPGSIDTKWGEKKKVCQKK